VVAPFDLRPAARLLAYGVVLVVVVRLLYARWLSRSD
jgi:hypothetical protein